MSEQRENLLEVKNLVKWFPIKTGLFKHTTGYVKAVDGITFSIKHGMRNSRGLLIKRL